MQAELSGIVKGKLKRIVVVTRGVSPRVIKANIVGTGGTTSTSGPTLRARLGLPDTWASFKKGGAGAAAAQRAWPNAAANG
jgi:stage II sporulation protein D